MNSSQLSQKVFLYIKTQMRGVTNVCICTPFFLVAACTDGSFTQLAHDTVDEAAQITTSQTQDTTPKSTPLYTPNRAVGQGQLNALENFMSKKWQITTINKTPLNHHASIDLTDFHNGNGQANTDCGTIYFKLDTSSAVSGTLSIVNIERQLNDCPHTTEDDIMRVLGDLYGFTRKDNTLTLLSLKDEITLIPTPASSP